MKAHYYRDDYVYTHTANKEVGTYLMLLTDTHFDNDKLLYLAKSEPGANLSNMSDKY